MPAMVINALKIRLTEFIAFSVCRTYEETFIAANDFWIPEMNW